MATIDARKAAAALQKKGFQLVNKDHHYYEFWHNGKVVARTHMSHNDQELDDWLIGKMKKQCLLGKEDFINLLKCPLSKEGYLKKLKEAGYI